MNAEDSRAYISQSIEALHTHRDSLPGGNATGLEFRHVMVNATKLHVQLWWIRVPSPVAPSFLWDSLDIELDDPSGAHEVLSAIATLGAFGIELSGIPAVVPKWGSAADVPMFALHPQRFRALHPLGKTMAQLGQGSPISGMTEEVMHAAHTTLMAAQREAMPRTGLRWKVRTDNRQAFTDVVSLGVFNADFNSAGRQILDFPARLVEMFNRTDVTDIPLDAINLPYRSFYIAFGQRQELVTKEGWFVDGAYVSVAEGKQVMQFALTSCPANPDQYAKWAESPEPVYFQSMTADQMKIGVGEAADLVFAEKMAELRRQIAKRTEIPESDGVRDITASMAAAELERLPRLQEAWTAALKLIVNAMAYLSSYPDDIEHRWPDSTPQRLYLQMQDGSGKQQRNAESKLRALGFTSVHFCGRKLRQASAPGTGGNGRSATATWVRGHWLRQAYGPGHSLRKLQWRMPLLRNADHEASEAPGHIYAVE